jgi:toxin HigB-1
MIVSFANRGTEDIFDGRNTTDARKLLPRELWNVAFRKLEGDRSGQYSIRINDQYRICFLWTSGGDAVNVEIVDYH